MVRLGMQFWPWNEVKDLLSYCEEAAKGGVDQIWTVDSVEYEDPFTLLAVAADRWDVSLGTMVTFPWRDPLQLAQRFASIAKVMRPGKELSLGIGRGGVIHALEKRRSPVPVEILEETLRLLRALLRGDAVPFEEFPGLVSSFGYNKVATARLFFPPPRPVPIYLAAGGPKTFRLAGTASDGVIVAQLIPRTSIYGIRHGHFDAALREIGPGTPVIYTPKFSVSRDRSAARKWAKRQASYGIATNHVVLKEWGFDRARINHIKEAYDLHLGFEEAASRVPDELFDELGVVTAGTPNDCIKQCEEIVSYLKRAKVNLTQLVPGVPLGPDVSEAMHLIIREIVPVLRRWID